MAAYSDLNALFLENLLNLIRKYFFFKWKKENFSLSLSLSQNITVIHLY